MTIDDDNSIYVGGLPYDCDEDSVRRVFDLYGAVVAVKIINDREVGGKCYGFVTFTNPRSAIDAINDMNGRTIGGRVVRVNEVRTRGGRPTFHRESFRRDFDRDLDWDRGRDKERNPDRERERYQDRTNDHSHDRDRDRERDYERGRDHDRSKAHFDRDYNQEDSDKVRHRSRSKDWYNDCSLEVDRDRDTDKAKDDRSNDKEKEKQSKNRLGGSPRFNDRQSREVSSNSSDDYHEQAIEQLEILIQRREELQKEVAELEDKVDEKQMLVSDLEKKSQKLEDVLATAKRFSSQRQAQLFKMQRCFLQVKECNERLKGSEQELQSLVSWMVMELGEVDGSGSKDGAICGNGRV